MKSINTFSISFLMTIAGLSAQVPDSLKFQSLGPHEFQDQYQKTDSALLIDVREPFEFSGKQIKGAINIPSSGNIERAADTLNKDYTLFLYCTSGFRSARVAKALYDKGFRKLVSLKGGIVAWRKEKLPVIKGKIRKRKAMGERRYSIADGFTTESTANTEVSRAGRASQFGHTIT